MNNEEQLMNHIKKENLEYDMNDDKGAYNYMLRIYKNYYPKSSIDSVDLIKKLLIKYLENILSVHSLIMYKKINYDKEIIDMFFNFLSDLYYDRDEGYKTEPLDLTKEIITNNMDLYTFMLNKERQVNLICFLEEQLKPNHTKRSDIITLSKLFDVGNIFDMIGYKVVVLGSEIQCQNNVCVWIHKPHKLNSNKYYLLSKYPTNCLNIYLDVDFDAN